MAKRRKRATLFDVINKGQPVTVRPPSSRRGPAATLRVRVAAWLLGSTPESISADKPPASAPVPERIPSHEPVRTRSESAVVALEALRAELRSATESPSPEPRAIEPPPRPKPRPAVVVENDDPESAGALLRFAHKLNESIARAKPVFSQGVRWIGSNGLIVAGVVLLFAGAFLVGRMLSSETARPLAQESDVAPPPANLVQAETTTRIVPAAKVNLDAPRIDPVSKRQVGLNYVIVQSYSEEADAIAAREVLEGFGIRTTVEPSLPGWVRPGLKMWSLVSVDGFEGTRSNREYNRFIEAVKRVSDQEYGKTLGKRLEPAPYKWPDRR